MRRPSPSRPASAICPENTVSWAATVGNVQARTFRELSRRAILDRVHAQQVRAQVRTEDERTRRVEEDFVWVWGVLLGDFTRPGQVEMEGLQGWLVLFNG